MERNSIKRAFRSVFRKRDRVNPDTQPQEPPRLPTAQLPPVAAPTNVVVLENPKLNNNGLAVTSSQPERKSHESSQSEAFRARTISTTGRPKLRPDVERVHHSKPSDIGGPVPSAVQFELVVFFGKAEHKHHEPIWVQWNDKTWFPTLEGVAERLLEEHGHVAPEDKGGLYKKAGRCRILRKVLDDAPVEIDSRVVESQREWDNIVPVMVAETAVKHTRINFNDVFFLELRLEYASLTIKRKSIHQKYANAVLETLYNNVQENWEKKKFIPRRVLSSLFTEATVRTLVKDDQSLLKASSWDPKLSGKQINTDKLVTDITDRGVRLLALTIYAKVDLSCVYQLLETCDNCDRDFTLQDCPSSIQQYDFNRLIDYQGLFKVHIFINQDDSGRRRAEHHKLDKTTVVPVLFDEAKDQIGEGSFGHVFKVTIHSDHHYFSSNRDTPFAMKRFKARDLTPEYFKKEAEALQVLAKSPHENIALHLASWTQDGRFYMLFPYADGGTLKHYLLKNSPPLLTGEFVLWLLSEMHDLAGAVQHIYNSASTLDKRMPVSPPISKRSPSKLAPSSSRKPTSHSGIHYDLKPENILLFSGSSLGQTVWRVTDFGLAEFATRVLSGSADPDFSIQRQGIMGDQEYCAPDEAFQDYSSRSYDIWSLGCIFLEILVWVFGEDGGNDLAGFQVDRLKTSDEPQINHQDTAFWYRSSKGLIKLKPKVVSKLETLRPHCARRGAFGRILTLTAHMLTLKPSERPNAPTVYNDMTNIVRQAESDLYGDPDRYLKAIDGQAPPDVTKSPTVRRKPSRPGSIDERSVDPNLATPLTQSPIHIDTGPHHHRTFSEPAVPSSPLLAVPNGAKGEERFVGSQWPQNSDTDRYPGSVSSNGSIRSRSPSISVHKGNGQIEVIHKGNSPVEDPFK